MQCKVRAYKLMGDPPQGLYPGTLRRVPSNNIELIWDEDIFFPLKYQEKIMGELTQIAMIVPAEMRNVPPYILQSIQNKINTALQIWIKIYGLTTDNKSFGDAKQCGILIKDRLYEFY